MFEPYPWSRLPIILRLSIQYIIVFSAVSTVHGLQPAKVAIQVMDTSPVSRTSKRDLPDEVDTDRNSDSTTSVGSALTMPTTAENTPGTECYNEEKATLQSNLESLETKSGDQLSETQETSKLLLGDMDRTNDKPLTTESVKQLMIEVVKGTDLTKLAPH